MRAAAILLLAASPAFAQAPKDPEGWAQHDLNRPAADGRRPGHRRAAGDAGPAARRRGRAVRRQGPLGLEEQQGRRPAAPWKVENGYFEVVKGTGGIETKQGFGDVQLHIEWMAPDPAKGESQDRGNSGVFFGGGRYEIQVLDSYGNKTYPDGQAGSLYGQYPPLVNASRAPGQWQAYDIVFEAPRFDAAGKLLKPARVTVFHNGVLVQHAMEFIGPATNKVRTPYSAHPEKLPIGLQDHNHPVRFRNVWVRELQPRQPKP